MITFRDGLAQGHKLLLSRAPVFLRVVIDHDGTVDALDQLDDVARPTEAIHVYRLVSQPSWAMICSRGKGCRREAIAEYRLNDGQPEDAIARDNETWRDWARDQKPDASD